MTIADPSDRTLESLRAIIRTELGALQYAGLFQYTISNVSGTAPSCTIDCSPVNTSIGLPNLTGIKIQPSVSGITGTPTSGMNCVVAFLDRDPTKPVIMGVDSLGANPVARLGDQVTVFMPPSMPIVGTLSGGPFTAGVITIANPVTGIISQGSGQVYSG